jgi:hypothetical protein
VTATHALLAALRRRGVEIQREGDRLRWRAPRGEIQPTDLAALRRAKVELLGVLAVERLGQSDVFDVEGAPILDARARVGAVLIRSARFGEMWLALDSRMAEQLAAEEVQRPDPRPVLMAEDVPRLRGKPGIAILAALEIARALPGWRVIQ